MTQVNRVHFNKYFQITIKKKHKTVPISKISSKVFKCKFNILSRFVNISFFFLGKKKINLILFLNGKFADDTTQLSFCQINSNINGFVSI